MKYLLYTIIFILTTNNIQACGYHAVNNPFIFSLYPSSLFNFKDLEVFNYNYTIFPDLDKKASKITVNIDDWYNYTNQKVSKQQISEFLNQLSLADIHPKSKNQFIKYLFQTKNTKAINYLKMAKHCEVFNTQLSQNNWEQTKGINQTQINNFTNQLQQALNQENDPYFKAKYAFQAIRLAYYNNDYQRIKTLFNQNFNHKTKDYIYYWSLYFYCFTKPENYQIYLIDIFANAPDKNYAVYSYFKDQLDLKTLQSQAKTNTQKANSYSFFSIQNVYKNLDNLKKIQALDTKNQLLDFLLVREINKLEDWIYTPYYTYTFPEVYHTKKHYNDYAFTLNNLKTRIANDRAYATQLLDFVNTVNPKNTQNPHVWQTAKLQLLFMTQQYAHCINASNTYLKNNTTNQQITDQVQKLKLLATLANQKTNNTTIPQQQQDLVFKHHNDKLFVFALARELEFKNNLADAAALFTYNPTDKNLLVYGDVIWQTKPKSTATNLPTFNSYYNYVDFAYTTTQLQQIVQSINQPQTTPFKQTLYQNIVQQKNYYIDLLATKHLRENNLQQALNIYNTLPQQYWDNNFNGWERDIYSEFIFNKNPFYNIKYTPQFVPYKQNFFVNKKTIVQHLIKFINLSTKGPEQNRAYYSFLVANCYYNMGQHGNSWFLKRTYSSSYLSTDNYNHSFIDEPEYRKNHKAIYYYNQAQKQSNSPKFKALCYKMIDFVNTSNYNPTNLLKTNYPQYLNDLSSCNNLNNYFTATY